MLNGNNSKIKSIALRVVIPYAILAGLWILFSDLLVEFLFQDPHIIAQVSVVKGWLFVAVTSLFLLGMIKKQELKNLKQQAEILGVEQRFKEMVENLPLGLGVSDLNGDIKYLNKAFIKMFGYSAEELPRVEIFANNIFIDKMTKDSTVEAWQKELNKKFDDHNYRISTFEFFAKRKDGEKIAVELNTTIIGKEIYVMYTDVSQRHKALESLKQNQIHLKAINDELSEANKKALAASMAKSEFLSNMSHEIRTPMNVVIGMCDLLLTTPPLSVTQEGYVQLIYKSGQTLLELINSILEISQIETRTIVLEKTNFNLLETIQDAINISSFKLQPKNLRLEKNISPAIPTWLKGDGLRIRQILLNLLNNATKFTESGSIFLEVKSDPLPMNKHCVSFSVTDSGIGIPADKIADIFQRFNQGDSSITKRYGGTGLGLSICKELVELMDGTIQVTSQEGKGTTFTFEIPFESGEVPPVCATLAQIKEVDTLPALTILLAEDTEENCTFMLHYFKNFPFKIDIAQNGLEALDKFKINQYDLVLMDMQMPKMDGVKATTLIREWEKENSKTPTPIIALTAYALSQEAERSLACGCNLHLTKPIRKAILLQAILEQVAN